LHSFWGGDGALPQGRLTQDTLGNLYGTTFDGGTPKGGSCRHGCGTVFKLDATGKFSILYAFSGTADGGNPTGGLIRDQQGSFYGTATSGGDPAASCGLVFKLDTNGKQTVLHAFKDFPDGCQPAGGLIRDKAGDLYGATLSGGAYRWGTVFKVDHTGKETVLYSFTNKSDGGLPEGPLVQDAMGKLSEAWTGIRLAISTV